MTQPETVLTRAQFEKTLDDARHTCNPKVRYAAFAALLAHDAALRKQLQDMKAVLADLVDIEQRNQATDPDTLATDYFRESTYRTARALLKELR